MAPTEKKALNPTHSRSDQSSMAVQSAPDWLMNATFPFAAIDPANVAFNPTRGAITPRQFGPMIRMLPFRASSSTCRSSSRPCGPVSRNPAEMIRPRVHVGRRTRG